MPESHFVHFYPLRLQTLPCWEGLEARERRRKGREVLQAARARAAEQREGRRALGADAVRRQDPHQAPGHVSRKRRPLCHASTMAAWRCFTMPSCPSASPSACASTPGRGNIRVSCLGGELQAVVCPEVLPAEDCCR